jgi:signal transduction histidine kinase
MLGQTGKSSGINVSGEIDDIDGALQKDEEIIFYRIAQECLNNVIKHSGAKNARLNVKVKDDVINLTCADDGHGFDVEAAKRSPESGLGLSGLNERIRILRGEYNIESARGGGTTISVKIRKTNE